MALESLQSKYGPQNKPGDIGTGEIKDTFAFEKKNNLGVEAAQSKYAGTEKIGTKPSGPDVFANIPAERSFE